MRRAKNGGKKPWPELARAVLTVTALMASSASLAWSQLGKGVITGTVSDPSGAAIPDAPLSLVNESTGVEHSDHTNSAGLYRFNFVDPGTYIVRVKMAGFSPYEIRSLVATVGQTVTRDVRLELAHTAQSITVEAGGVQLVNTANAEVSGLVGRSEIQNLPLEIRDATAFVNLQPGAMPDAFNGSTRGAAVNGQRGGTGNFMIDGTDNNDYGQAGRSHNISAGIPGGMVSVSPDAVQEFRVVTNNFSAEYGRQGGFVTDLVLRSGSNQLHGSAFEFNRNSATTADDFFSAKSNLHDQLVRNQFGGSLGGPIKKDKMFIFGAVELQRLRQSTPFTTTGIRQQFVDFVDSGAFAQFANQHQAEFGLSAPINCSNPGNYGCSLGPVFEELDSKYPLPRATTPLSAGDYFSSSSIFPGAASGANTGLVQYPVPAFGQITFPEALIANEARGSVRFDYNISERDLLQVHYLVDDFPQFFGGQGGDFANPAFGQDTPGRAQNGAIGYTHTFGPSILNEFKFAYLRAMGAFPRQDAQIPSIGTVDILGVGFGTSEGIPQTQIDNTFQWQDNLTINRGRHNLKVGGEYRRTRNGSTFDNAVNGFYQFWDTEDLLTDGAIGDLNGSGGLYLAQGATNPASPVPASPDTYRGYRSNEMGAYFEDNWKVRDRVTLNLGVRYDYFGVPHNFRPNIDSNFYYGSSSLTQCIVRSATGTQVCLPGSGVANPVSTNPNYPVNGFTAREFGGTFQIHNHDLWNKDPNNFAPRLGVAWDVFGTQKTVVRLGGGMFYDRIWNNLFENIRFNPPYFAISSFGAAGNGSIEGPFTTPGFYSSPISVANFAGPGGTPSPRHMDQNIRTPYSEQINFDLQQQVANGWLVDLAYIGTFGHKLTGVVDLNTFDGRTISGLSTQRINPNISIDNARANFYNSNYHAFQARVTRRLSHGFQFDGNYTWSHALDYVSDAFNNKAAGDYHPEDTFNRNLEYGNADFDVRHRFVADFEWEIPMFHSSRLLGGWAFNGILMWQSGSPFTIYDSAVDSNHDGAVNDRATFVGSGNISSAINHNISPADGYLKASSFAATTPPGGGFTDGLLARNAVFGPNFFENDVSLSKQFRLKERAVLKVIVSGFNIWNHPNFSMVPLQSGAATGNVSSAQFGQAQSTVQPNNTGTGGRVFQFAARIDF